MRYRPELDGMRAVAIGSVMLFHAYPAQVRGGWVGVDIFFVLSGYLITTILLAEIDRTGTIRLGRFYARRALRLLPALALLLATLAVLEFLLFDVDRSTAGWSMLMAGTYLMNWNRAFAWGPVGALGHTWSLAIEEQFYLLWPLTLLGMPAARRLPLSLALLVAVIGWRLVLLASGASAERLFNGFDTHADPLLVGCILAQLTLTPEWRARLERRWFVPAGLLLLAALAVRGDSGFALTAGFPLVAAAAAWLIVAATGPGPLQAILRHRPLVAMGQVSYGIYLWHDPLLIIFRQALPAWLAILPALAAIPIAVASYQLVERPVLRLRDRLQSVGGGLPLGFLGFFARERDA